MRTIKIVSEDYEVSVADLLSGRKFGKLPEARKACIDVLLRQNYSLSQVGRWLKLHHTSVAYYRNQGRKTVPDRLTNIEDITCPDYSGEWAI